MMPTRRQFLSSTAAAAAAALAGINPAGRRLFATAAGPDHAAPAGGYSFPLLGDLHFDRLAHHDMDWLRREKPGDVRQVERYSRVTADVSPGLMAEVRRQVEGAARPVPFVVQLGDLVEGLCGTPELARRHCEEAAAFVADARLGAPMLLTKGNHDITGPGAKEAFDDVLLPAFRHPAARQQSGANFVAVHGSDWFVFFDAYSPDSLPWLERVLRERDPRAAGAGHLFFVVHPPVVPYTARCWHVYERGADATRRPRLLRLLGGHRAIVLNGHLHKYGLLSRTCEGGGLRQLSAVSVIPEPGAPPRQEREGVEHYGAALTDLEPAFSPPTLDARKRVLAEESAHVTDYAYADAPGYAMVHVTPDEVTADVFVGLGRPAWKTVRLSGASRAEPATRA